MQTGKVKWFNEQKGFGGITPDDGTEELFFYSSSIVGGYRTFLPNEPVVFDKQTTDKGFRAANIQNPATATSFDGPDPIYVSLKAMANPNSSPQKPAPVKTSPVPPRKSSARSWISFLIACVLVLIGSAITEIGIGWWSILLVFAVQGAILIFWKKS